MTTLTSTDPRVVSFFNRYHAKVKTHPSLYTNQRDGKNAFLMTLPADLLGFAERGAGHSGFGTNARPVGMRRVVCDAKKALTSIFSSTSTLANFINTSTKDGHEYILEVRQRHSTTAKKRVSTKPVDVNMTDGRPAKDVFFQKYTTNDAKSLQIKFGREMVVSDFNLLTINEFELRYGLN